MTIDPSGQPGITRRDALRSSLAAAAGGVALTGSNVLAEDSKPDPRRSSPKRFEMKKSINLWAFPYPDRMNLRECLQLAKDAGFDGVELNYDLENDLSPASGTNEYHTIRKLAEEIGIAISGVCSFLFWPYSLTDNDPARRARGMELARLMVRAAHDLGTENLLVVPGAVHMPWRDDHTPVPNDVCDRRAREAIGRLLPLAEELGVSLNIENIFFNGYLLSPEELSDFIDHFGSDHVRAHFDTGNIMLFQYPEHWISILGSRIKNTHFKEFSKKGTDYSLESFSRPPFFGTTNWPAVMEALDGIHYDGYVTWEYFYPTEHYPEAAIYWTSDGLDRILGRKV
ncbi:sugar phosphate isomerase/epimerase [soil metagenome]